MARSAVASVACVRSTRLCGTIALLAWMYWGSLAAGRPQSVPTSEPASQPSRKRITLDVIQGRGRVNFDGSYASGMTWLPDGRHFLHRRDGKLMRVDALTDTAEPAFDVAAIQKAFETQTGLEPADAERIAANPGEWSGDRTRALVKHSSGIYVLRLEPAGPRVSRVAASDNAERRELTLGPAGRALAFVRDSNLYSIDAASGQERQLTHDGSATLLNGVLDWVYQEEIYGRGDWRSYWWSDDDAHLAFLQLDESAVPVYTIVHQAQSRPSVETLNYPKPGDPNPTVRLGIVPTAGGAVVWADLGAYASTEILISRVSWSPRNTVIFSVQDREQRWLDLNEADPVSGSVRTLVRESSPAWNENLPHPRWLKDGSFLWQSDRDGYRHVFHYQADGTLLRRLTRGDWDAREILGVDESSGWVYFAGTREGPLEIHAYRVPLAGGETQRLTEPGFGHSVSLDPTCSYFFDDFSNVHTPTKVYLRRADGSLERVISENKVETIAEYAFGETRLVELPARDGFTLRGRLVLPPDYQSGRRYPVWCSVYAGPDAQTVFNRWGGHQALNDQYLANEGYVVWRIDPRSASGQGLLSAWQAWCRLGTTELADIEDSLRWLIDAGYADPERIGITGFSYGGYMTAFALTHSTMFRMGIAGAPVTDWGCYDTIYTERYMRTPQNNPAGYASSSTVRAAENLHGKLLLIHGMIDENVHFQNSALLIDALQKAGREFELMVYPRDRHGIFNGGEHFRELQARFLREKL